jgi:MFS family permease
VIIVGQRKTLIGLNLSVFMMMLGVGMTMALLPKKIIDLTGSGSIVGYLASAFAISYIVLQLPIGNLSDKLGFKFFLFSGYLLCFATGLLYYFSNNANMIFLGRIFQGAGEAPVWALAPALLSIKYPNSKGKVIGIYNAAIHIGLTVGPILGIAALKIWTGNQAFLFYSFVCLVGAVITLVSVENANKNEITEKEAMNFKNILALVSDRSTFVALAGITLYGAGYGIFLTIIPAFLISIKGFSQTFIGVFFSLFYGAISLSQIITGHFSDKMGREIFMIAGLIIAALGLGIFPGLGQPLISIVLTLASLGLGVFYLSSMAFLNEIVPNSLKGTISGAYYLFWGIGFFFGPILIGKLGELPGFNKGYYAYSIALILEAVTMTYFYRKSSKYSI